MALTDKLSAIGEAIRFKTGKTDTLTLDQMPTEIESIETGGIPEEALIITGDCQYRFHNGGWDWFIREYGNKVTTQDITAVYCMFAKSKIEEIPFEINIIDDKYTSLGSMFWSCENLKSIPKINNCIPDNTSSLFSSAHNLRYLPDDFADWFDWSYIKTKNSGSNSGMFNHARSIRTIPADFLEKSACPKNTYNTSYFSSGFNSCYVLDELILPIPYTATWTGNAFNTAFNSCSRLKNLIFALDPDTNSPYVMNWKSQTIDLSVSVGYGSLSGITGYNSGITTDKQVKNEATYQSLKNDPDWFTCEMTYSRYNHDSAVATINSLPDTSAYLASAGGTNTIRFKGASGSLTDGGAINTLTAEEIAVATAKGWTVAFS